jgi:hypothetical protein
VRLAVTHVCDDRQPHRLLVEMFGRRRASDASTVLLARVRRDLLGPIGRAAGLELANACREPRHELGVHVATPFRLAVASPRPRSASFRHSTSAFWSTCSSTGNPWRSYRFRARLHFSTTAASVEYFRARRVSAASPGGRNVRWSRSAQVRQRAPRSPARKAMACRPRSSPQSSQRNSRLEMNTRRSREARSPAALSEVTDSSVHVIADNARHDIDLDMKSDAIATEAVTAPVLTPHGRLLLEPVDDAEAASSGLSHRLRTAFARGSGHGLLQLGAAEVGTTLPPVFGYWREFAARYVSAVCGEQDLDASRSHAIIGPHRPTSSRSSRRPRRPCLARSI